MPKIKDIFFTDVMELAVKKAIKHNKTDITTALECDLLSAFDWQDKPGWIFLYGNLDKGIITRKELKKYILTLKQ